MILDVAISTVAVVTTQLALQREARGGVVGVMEIISNVHIQPQMKDTLRWTAEPSGLYSTRSAYRLITTANSNLPQANIYKTIWRLNIPSRAAIFFLGDYV